MSILKVGTHTLDLGRAVPEAEQKWRRHLAVVSVGPRYIGLVSDPNEAVKARPFTLYHAMDYVPPQIGVSAPPPGTGDSAQVRISVAAPPIIIPFDALAPATLRVMQCEYIFLVTDQEEKFQKFLFEAYQQHFAASRIIQPPSRPLPTDIIAK